MELGLCVRSVSELRDTISQGVVLLRAISLTAELREDFASTGSLSVSEVGQIAQQAPVGHRST